MTKLIKIKGVPVIIPFVKRIRKKLGKDSGHIGLFHYGAYEYGADNEIGFDMHGVYQMRQCAEGYIPIKMKFQATREETPTPARTANWNLFKDAMTAWHDLTDEQRQEYNIKARSYTIHGVNLFIREYMREWNFYSTYGIAVYGATIYGHHVI